MWSFLIIIAHLICGCLIESVESRESAIVIFKSSWYNTFHSIENHVITRHNLPQNRLELVYGSKRNGNCTNVSQSFDGSPVCASTSVLNDGIIPSLDGISSNETSSWATELFTLRKKRKNYIII